MDAINRFKCSFGLLQQFLEAWLPKITERCKAADRRLAGYYVWARYSMSIRTLDALNDPRLIPDIAVICRGCLEFDVSLEAVITSEELAREYLEFDKHAKAKYLKLLGKHGEIDRMLEFRKHFDQQFGEEPDDFNLPSWCHRHRGVTGLLERFGRKYELRLYNMLSHFAHGSVSSLQALDQWSESPDISLGRIIDAVYSAYLSSSHEFLEFIWEPLVTPDGERCKHEFPQVMASSVNLP